MTNTTLPATNKSVIARTAMYGIVRSVSCVPGARSILPAELRNKGSRPDSHRLVIPKRSVDAALPKVREDNHTRDGCIGTPDGSERISLDCHHHQQNGEIHRTENNHVLHFGKEK